MYEYKHCTHLVVVELLGCSDVQHRAAVTLSVEQGPLDLGVGDEAEHVTHEEQVVGRVGAEADVSQVVQRVLVVGL